MGNDFWLVLQWWGTLFLVGSVAFPLTKALFPSWYDRGYFFAKAVGLAIVTYGVYLLAMLHVAPFRAETIFWVLIAVFAGGLVLHSTRRKHNDKWDKEKLISWGRVGKIIALEELLFFAGLLFWAWIKGHEPSVRGLEKFMDYGFMKSILEAQWFPAPDMWYTGFPINYYYFGHTVVAVLTKLSGIDLAYAFNLMLATLFALTLTMSFSIGVQLMRGVRGIHRGMQLAGGVLTSFLVTLAGNMQTLYAFTKGYTGEDVLPFWQLLWPLGDIIVKLPEGLERYWYANATRFIPFTIHEFPSYSFVVSDIHGHVLSLPFTLLAIALLIHMGLVREAQERRPYWLWGTAGFYGLLVAVLLMTNALDGPIYLGLFFAAYITMSRKSASRYDYWIPMAIVVIAAGFSSLPFLTHFRSFVSGVAFNCPPSFLADKKIGVLLFETVDKCQRSPFWMLWLLWGFFWFSGIVLIAKRLWRVPISLKRGTVKWIRDTWDGQFTLTERLLVIFFIFSTLLIIFPEFFYFKDIYPAHFRSNTMFKLGYQAFILFSIISAYTISLLVGSRDRIEKKGRILKIIVLVCFIPQLFLVVIYPIFSVRSYFNSLKQYQGLHGLTWLAKEFPDDYGAILWLNQNATCRTNNVPCTRPVIVEADGDSYTDYARFSAFTGLETIVGWPVHEWLWRGSYEVVAPRREDIRIIYESDDIEETRVVLSRYNVTYVLVGSLEREKFPELRQEKLEEIGQEVFASGDTKIYEVGTDFYRTAAPQSSVDIIP